MDPITVFILAAGLGERLRPITDHIPKPLLPILGKPVIEKVIEKTLTLSPVKIGMNMHFKWEMIRDWVQKSPFSERITLFCEKDLLGTGGALKNAESFLRESIFLVHNSDIISDINLTQLVERHIMSGNEVTLAVHNRKGFNNVWIDRSCRLQFVGEKSHEINDLRQTAFTGIAVYSPQFFDIIPEGPSHIVDSWLKASSEGAKIGTADFTGCLWSDVGSPDSYAALAFEMLKEEGEVIYVHPSVDIELADIGTHTIIEKGCRIKGRASLKNCIVLPGAVIDDGLKIENSIAGPDYALGIVQPVTVPSFLSSALLSSFESAAGHIQMTLIGTGGSDRKYFRLRDNEKTAILMECPHGDPDLHRHLLYTEFFRKWSVPVPELLGTDTGGTVHPASIKRGCLYALFEDLGDLSLYSWLKCRKDPARIEKMYRSVIDVLVRFHTTVTQNISGCLLLKSRVFDYDHLRWETSYFIERFVREIKEREICAKETLDHEFERLARRADSFGKTVIHRDFQSQNIMVTKEDVPRVIDYQGARMGPPAYDVSSLLWDPYFRLDDTMRLRLLDYYSKRMKDYDKTFDNDKFLQTVLPCRLQRHMQALGAYGYLSKLKGKKYFLKYVPQALEYLKEEVELVRSEYPALCEIVKNLDDEKDKD